MAFDVQREKQTKQPKKYSARSGNILFLILLAVILFAALSYAVTQSMRGDKNASSEQMRLVASQLIQSVTLLEQNMMRARTINSIPDYGFDLSYKNSAIVKNDTCVVPQCRMFVGSKGGPVPEGGAVTPVIIPETMRTSTEANSYPYSMVVAVEGVGSPLEDVVMTHRYLSEEMCETLNEMLQVKDKVDLGVVDAIAGDDTLRLYSGTLTSIAASGARLGEVANLRTKGLRSFCFNNSSWGYIYIHVLIER